MSNVSTGHILNLMANDAQRFDEIPTTLHYIWIGPLQVIVLTILLWREIGIACLSGLAVILLLLPVQIIMAKLAVHFRSDCFNPIRHDCLSICSFYDYCHILLL